MELANALRRPLSSTQESAEYETACRAGAEAVE